MSNLYQFLEKTKKNNLFLEDNEILKKKLFLLKIEEIQLFKRDKEVFKHFYGENNFNALSKVIKNKTSDEFTNFFEVRTGKLKYLIEKIENKLKQEKNSNKIFILENELKKLRKKENRLYVTNNRKIKNAYLLNEEDEKKEQKESLFNRGLKKFENLTTDLISFGAKSNKAEDSTLIKATRIILKVLAMAYGLYVTASLVTAFPVLIVPVAVALGTCLVYLVAVGTTKAIKFLKKIAESNKEIISKFLGITLEDINKYLDNAEGLADLINSKIKAFKEKAKKIFVDNFMKKINLFFKNNPKLSFTVSVLFLLLKTGNILVNPISFLIQFFSGMLMKSCGAVVDKFLAVLEKNKDKEGDDLKNIITKTLLGFEIKTDETKKEPEVTENSSFNYKNLVNDFEQYYYEHITNNIVKESLFLKENNIFYEVSDKGLLQAVTPNFYKMGKLEVTIASLKKGAFKADIRFGTNQIYIKKTNGSSFFIEKDPAKIQTILKTIGVSEEDLKKIKITNNYIELTKETLDILQKAFDSYVPGVTEAEIANKNKTEAETGETKGEENKGEEKTGTEEAKPEEEKIKNDEAAKLLNDNQKLYIPIKNDSSGEQLEIGKDMPSKDDDNILGYIELDKQGVNKNNYRFSGKISIKKVFDYSTNKLTSLLFEEPEIQQKEFLNITKEPALISIRIENGKYIINSGKFLGMFGEKSKKGKVNETFFDYIRFGIKKIKEDYLNKNSLEINKLNQTERGELDKKINDILFNFDKTDNFTNIKLDALKERKGRDLETIKFSSLKTEEKIGKENLLTLKEIYININDEKTQINVADLPLVAEKPVDGIGYVKFIKIKDAKYNAYFFSKKAFNYEKNNFLKTIFEEDTPETETLKNDFIDLTGEPAEVEIKLENDKFALSQKGGFLGFNKKIDKIGKVNTNYKEYIKNIIPEIEKDLVKNLIDKNETDVQDKIKDISDIELTDAGIKAAKDKKIEEIKKESQGKTNNEVDKEAEQENMPFISKRNALTLGLFSAISIIAVAFHASGGVLNPKVALLIAIIKDGEAEKIKDFLKNPKKFSEAMNSIDTEETLNKISDNVAGNAEVEVTTNPDELQKDLTNDSLKNTQSALENNTQQSASTAMGDEDSGVDGGGGQSEEGVGGVSTKLNIDKKQVFDNLSEKGIVKKSDVFKKIKESWIASHENSEIKSIDDIKPGSELYKKLENFTDKVIGSVDSIKDKPDGFYTKTPTLVSAINSDPDSAINIIQDKLNASIEKGWTANQIAKIDGSVTVPENNSPIPKEVIENTPKPINPILVIDPPKDPSSITDPIPKVDEEIVQPSKPATAKTPDTGDETVKPKNVNLDVEPEKPNVPPSTGDNLTPDQKVTPEPGAPEPEKPNVDQKTPETNVKEPEKPIENKNIPKNLVQAQTDAIYSVNEISDEKVLNDLKIQFEGEKPNIKLIASLLKIDEETAKNIVNNTGSKESILKNIESRLKELSASNSAPNTQETVSDAAQNSNVKKEAIKSTVSDNASGVEYLQKYTDIVEQLKKPEFENETLKELRNFIETGDITNNTGEKIIFKSPIDGTQKINTLKGFGIDGKGLYTTGDYGYDNMSQVWNYFAREGKLNWTPTMFKLILEDEDKMKEILNAINVKYPPPAPETINQSYQYMSKDEKFLFNEYFKLESKLNRWKK